MAVGGKDSDDGGITCSILTRLFLKRVTILPVSSEITPQSPGCPHTLHPSCLLELSHLNPSNGSFLLTVVPVGLSSLTSGILTDAFFFFKLLKLYFIGK